MDKMEIKDHFNGVYYGKKVFVTGHTGFKGSWLTIWLTKMGSIVKGYSLPPNTQPSHWDLLKLNLESVFGDIRNKQNLEAELCSFDPDIVFHLAAQPLVASSYSNPYETYETNVMGTVALLEACKKAKSLKAVVIVTTDKCYENKEWIWGYRENEPMGGHDPYSSSKACVEILASSYRRSFFNLEEYGQTHQVLLSSARAGNVIGGGDWADHRLIPDIMKANYRGESAVVRRPEATRPWQHVLDPLAGYLILGQKLLERKISFADAWNFGPNDDGNFSVRDVVNEMQKFWPELNIEFDEKNEFHEANLLMLDSTKARRLLKWKPVWESCLFEKTAAWYRELYQSNKLITDQQLREYFINASEKSCEWIKRS